ncbi:S26 family signal peptidase [Nonomuraea sp. B10E15]|uniref:S26 family signal peptidase n=1 Tax=Nonomuraea sp. B10E15 TaxID=3153560 RepID=UPI00325C7FB7
MSYLMAAFAVCVAAATALVLARRRLTIVTVAGSSMLPTYRPGDRVLVRKIALRRLRRDHVLVFEPCGPQGWSRGPLPRPEAAEWVIKRLVALPGDAVPPQVITAVGASEGATVPPGNLVVVGDGVDSADSRIWGYLPDDRVLGVVVRTLSPPGVAGAGS